MTVCTALHCRVSTDKELPGVSMYLQSLYVGTESRGNRDRVCAGECLRSIEAQEADWL
jgi:hypothetical protein